MRRFSPDGRLLVTAGGRLWDEWLQKRHVAEIRIWDVESHDLMTAFAGHTEGVEDCEFSPDGKRLATSGFDGKVKVWDVQELLDYGAAMRSSVQID